MTALAAARAAGAAGSACGGGRPRAVRRAAPLLSGGGAAGAGGGAGARRGERAPAAEGAPQKRAAAAAPTVVGTCLWYDTAKGFGLIQPAEGQQGEGGASEAHEGEEGHGGVGQEGREGGAQGRSSGGAHSSGDARRVFVHRSQLRGRGSALSEGERVEFVMGTRMGKPYAKDVRCVGTPPGRQKKRQRSPRAASRERSAAQRGGAGGGRRGNASDALATLADRLAEVPAGAPLDGVLDSAEARRLRPKQLTTLFGMLKARCSSARIDELLAHLQAADVSLNTFTYSAAVSALCAAARREGGTEGGERAERVVSEMAERGAQPNQVTYTALMHYHADRGSLERALELFELLKTGADEGEPAHGRGQPDLFAYSTVMKACYDNATGTRRPGYGGKLVARLAEQLESSGQLAAADHSLLMLAVWGKGQAGDWRWGAELVRRRAREVEAGGAGVPRAPDLGLWNAAIAACSACGEAATAANLATEMVECSLSAGSTLQVDGQTLVNALGACRGGGAMAEAAAGQMLELMDRLHFSPTERCEVYEQAIRSLALPLKSGDGGSRGGSGGSNHTPVHDTVPRREAAFALLERMREQEVPRRATTYALILRAQGGDPIGTWHTLRMMADDGVAVRASAFKGAMSAISQIGDAELIDEMAEVATRFAEADAGVSGRSAQLFCAAIGAAGRAGDTARVKALRQASEAAFGAEVPRLVLEALIYALAKGCCDPEEALRVWKDAEAREYELGAAVASGMVSSCRVNKRPQVLQELIESIDRRERLVAAARVSDEQWCDAPPRSVWNLWSYAQAVGCFAEADNAHSAVDTLEALLERANAGEAACAICAGSQSVGECTTLLRSLRCVRADREASTLLAHMRAAQVEMDGRLYVASLEALSTGGSAAAKKEAVRLVRECLEQFVVLTPYEYNKMIHAAAQMGHTECCLELLERMQQERITPNLKCCNATMAAMTGDLDGCIALFDSMVENGPEPDTYTYATLTTAAGQAGETDLVAELLHNAADAGVASTTVTFSAVIAALGRAGDIFGALATLHAMSSAAAEACGGGADAKAGVAVARSVSPLAFAAEEAPLASDAARVATALGVVAGKGGWTNPYNAAITACALCDTFEHVDAVRAQMRADGVEETSESRQILVAVAAKAGHFDDAFEALLRYREEALLRKGDLRPYAHLAAAAGAAGNVAGVDRLLRHMREHGPAPDALVLTNAIRAHAHGGDNCRARAIFDEGVSAGVHPDVRMYHVLMSGLAAAGEQHEMPHVLQHMRENGVAPDRKLLELIDTAFDFDFTSAAGVATRAELELRLGAEDEDLDDGEDSVDGDKAVGVDTSEEVSLSDWAKEDLDAFYSGVYSD